MARCRTNKKRERITINDEISLCIPPKMLYTTDRKDLVDNHCFLFMKEDVEDGDLNDPDVLMDDLAFQSSESCSLLIPRITDDRLGTIRRMDSFFYSMSLELKVKLSLSFLTACEAPEKKKLQKIKQDDYIVVYALLTDEPLNGFAIVTLRNLYLGKFWLWEEKNRNKRIMNWLETIEFRRSTIPKEIAKAPLMPLTYLEGKRSMASHVSLAIPDQLQTFEESLSFYGECMHREDLEKISENYNLLAFSKEYRGQLRSCIDSGFTIMTKPNSVYVTDMDQSLWKKAQRRKEYIKDYLRRTRPIDCDTGIDLPGYTYRTVEKGLDAGYQYCCQPDGLRHSMIYLVSFFYENYTEDVWVYITAKKKVRAFHAALDEWISHAHLEQDTMPPIDPIVIDDDTDDDDIDDTEDEMFLY